MVSSFFFLHCLAFCSIFCCLRSMLLRLVFMLTLDKTNTRVKRKRLAYALHNLTLGIATHFSGHIYTYIVLYHNLNETSLGLTSLAQILFFYLLVISCCWWFTLAVLQSERCGEDRRRARQTTHTQKKWLPWFLRMQAS